MGSASNRIRLQPAYVLHSRPYRDSSLLVEAFAAEHGRISLVARGARRTSRTGSQATLLQPFVPLLISFSGGGDLKTLTGVEAVRPAYTLVGNRLFSAIYLNELLMRLLHRYDPHPELFAHYGEVLTELGSAKSPDAPLRRFELALLRELGYHLDLTHDWASGAPIEAACLYRYASGHGMQALSSAEEPSEPAYRGADLLAMAAGDFDGALKPVAKRLLREVLSTHLGEEPLKSRELFQKRFRGRVSR